MRKPRDFDAELKALTERTKQLKTRRVQQLGELVIATGVDGLDVETLAGALLAALKADQATQEGWHKAGARFFHGARPTALDAASDRASAAARADSSQPPDTQAGKA